MSDERCDRLRRTYLRLGTGELAAAAAFTFLGVVVVAPRLPGGDDRALAGALLPLVLVLAQAGTYWLLARSWVARSTMPSGIATAYRALRIVDVAALTLGLVVVVAALPASSAAAVVVVGIWLFGVIEYVNYFVVRLAYPADRWLREVGRWRTPQLVHDLRRAR